MTETMYDLQDWGCKAFGSFHAARSIGLDATISALAAGAVAFGPVSLKLAKRLIDLEEKHQTLQSKYGEIAFLAKLR